MIQQTVESKYNEYGLGNTETNLSTSEKQCPVAVKKTALRDVQNENRIPSRTENSSKDRVSMEAVKVSGAKRSSSKEPASPHYQSPNSNAANAHLVYVRRKSETETGKSSISNIRSITTGCLNSRQIDYVEKTTQLKPQIKEPKVSCFSSFVPVPVVPLGSTSGKPSVSFPIGNSNTKFVPAESNHLHVASTTSANNLKGMKNMHWEERFCQLQIVLKKCDESDREEYLETLRSLSSVELSRHAVELEKRSIQLSLEEAKEVQRVGVLNILGKSMKNIKASTSYRAEPEKQ